MAVYVHWPYCSRICPYCDFNVYKGAQNEALVSAILRDLSHWRDQSGPRDIISIHFGGGTPSLMSAVNVEKIIRTVDDLWGLPDDAEIGLEANPSDADEGLWRGYRSAGLNRLSLGIQSFDDDALKFLGRNHNGALALTASKLAMDVFENISMDLIYGLTGFDPQNDLEILAQFHPPHISTYQLTIEEGTAFHRAEQRGQIKAINPDKSADIFEQVERCLGANNYNRYEISNWSLPGFESRHNRAYWLGHDYVGVGPGAHGRLTHNGKGRIATTAWMKPDSYIKSVKEQDTGIELTEILTAEDWAAEYVMMGLRISDGISVSKLRQIQGGELPETPLKALIADGFLYQRDDRLSVTRKGRDVLDYITAQLLI